jgi:hypothetical protein
MKNKILFGFLFGLLMSIIIVSMVFIVSAEMLVSDAGVGYDSEIIDRFNQNLTSVNIFFKLKNMSEANDLLSTFSKNEFGNIIRRPDSSRIGGEITRQGFDKLISDSRVEVVYYNIPVYATENETIEEVEGLIPEIEKKELELGWFGISIGIIVIILIIILYLILKKKG